MDKPLQFHPAAALFDLLQGVEFEELVASIKERGFDPLYPIVLHEDKILDGRNRYRAAKEAGVKPIFVKWENGGNPWPFVYQVNGTRRHVSETRKASIYLKMKENSDAYELIKNETGARANAKRSKAAKAQPRGANSEFRPTVTASEDATTAQPYDRSQRTDAILAKHAGVSEPTMARALAIWRDRRDLHDLVCSGEITLNEGLRRKRKDEVRAKLTAFPSAKYRVIYADPPWQYGDQRAEGEGLAHVGSSNHYPSMSMVELVALDVVALTADNAVLFLWATAPLLPEGIELLRAWGFEYKQQFVWNKLGGVSGNYTYGQHELLLIGTRGSCLPDVATRDPSVVSIKRSKIHSQKPAEFRALIDKLYPLGKRIELFARGKLPTNWESWGAEATH